MHTLVILFALAAAASPARAQLVVKLKPETVAEFDDYARKIEQQLNDRWRGRKNFVSIEDDRAERERVMRGELFIRQLNAEKPVEITDGLIHDWRGAVFIPNASMEQVLGVLWNFDRHHEIYPEITKSRTVSRNGNDVAGYWRLQHKGLVPVVLNVPQSAHYEKVAEGKWICRDYAKEVSEVDSGLFASGKTFPAGEGHGYLWRLYAYWSLEAVAGGVLAESRTLSLTRRIPEGVAWAVAPYVQKQPQESLLSTLRQTRKAVEGKLAK